MNEVDSELNDNFPMPTYGEFHTDENGYLTAIFPRDSLPTEPNYIGISFSGHGTGGTIPEQFIS